MVNIVSEAEMKLSKETRCAGAKGFWFRSPVIGSVSRQTYVGTRVSLQLQ